MFKKMKFGEEFGDVTEDAKPKDYAKQFVQANKYKKLSLPGLGSKMALPKRTIAQQ
jgi:hypothetical protein